MSIDKKIVIIIILVLLSCLSGCTLFKNTEFSLYSSVVYDDDGFASIMMKFKTTDKTILKLFSPNKGIVFLDDYYNRGTYDVVMHLEEYRKTPTPGTYKLKAYDANNNLIFEDKFFFNGENLSITNVVEEWWLDSNKYSLVGLNVTIKNSGDLPVYPYSVDVNIDNKESSGFLFPEGVFPHKSKNVNCFVYINDVSSGSCLLELSVKNSEGNIITNTSYTVFPSETVSNLEYNWNYNGYYALVLPDVEFLYDYYSNRERLALDDFSAYIFDVYDDQYLDLFVEKFLALFGTADDVDLINFVASFVQYLEYAEDEPPDLPYDNPRFPIEMVVDKKGDCEDKAILTTAILDNMGYNVSLLRFPNHMAVGVHLDENVTDNYEYYIEEYYFLETTRNRWVLGRVPDEYKGLSNVTAHPISLRPLLIHSWKNATRYNSSDGSDFVKMKIIVENLGRETAYNFEIRAAFYSDNDIRFNQETALVSELAVGMKKEVDLTVNVPKGVSTTLTTQIYLNNEMVQEKKSVDSFS